MSERRNVSTTTVNFRTRPTIDVYLIGLIDVSHENSNIRDMFLFFHIIDKNIEGDNKLRGYCLIPFENKVYNTKRKVMLMQPLEKNA